MSKLSESNWISLLNGVKSVPLAGLAGASKAYQVLRLCEEKKVSAWVITKGPKEEEAFFDDLVSLGEFETLLFPEWDILPHEDAMPQREIMAERLDSLQRLALYKKQSNPKPVVMVASVESLLLRVFSESFFSSLQHLLKVDQNLKKEQLLKMLARLGYESFPMVGQRGEFSQRGGIVDFFPLNRKNPIRLEFFGDQIESLREFNPENQRSLQNLEKVELLPVDEKEVLLQSSLNQLTCLLDYAAKDSLLFIDEPDEVMEKINVMEQRFSEQKGSERIQKLVLFDLESRFCERFKTKTYSLQNLNVELDKKQDPHLLLTQPLESFISYEFEKGALQKLDFAHQRVEQLIELICEWMENKNEVNLFCNNEGEKERLLEFFPSEQRSHPLLKIKIGSLSGGFVLKEEKKVFLSDQEIFGRYKIKRSRWKFSGASVNLPQMDLKEGQYVVHLNQGIGLYKGITLIPIENQEQEVMEIEYANRARLYVPLIDSHLVERYQGFTEKKPDLDKLGGLRWRATKIRAERAIRDYASELIELQAERFSLKGTAFSKDKPWQREFEAAFLYEETPDQLDAIRAIKGDLENHKPMDRLLCGDVGYGKTEVAIRAAFKVVLEGRQVAILVPTTVLAQQHGQTFSERLADYPIRVDVLSRFKTRKEQRLMIEALKKGELDIVIGTHRLVQPDVSFKDLGLVIVDEEQRFGVRHKERLKKLRRLVDVLTLTATPIPRTLYFSLIGIKDMSAIQTPPVDRLPIETHLVEFDKRLIQEAIRREMNREGQVFFVHNRVESIERMKDQVQEWVPEARVEIGHGQMHADELEMVMKNFVEGQIDVLVCTTIIESGLDIPNANTILINRADRFGLAELYQLRGRVGRFKHKAYAYLLLPLDRVVAVEAKKRLKALMELNSLGSGFKIAMKDLEIRGAGNILGEEQSGHIAAIGFDLYCKLLKKTVEKLKAIATGDLKELPLIQKRCQIKIGIEACFPVDYISDLNQRVELYQRLGEVEKQKQIQEIRLEVLDRFGKMPKKVARLFEIAEIGVIAAEKKVDWVELKENKLLLRSGSEYIQQGGRWKRVYESQPEAVIKEVKKVLFSLERR